MKKLAWRVRGLSPVAVLHVLGVLLCLAVASGSGFARDLADDRRGGVIVWEADDQWIRLEGQDDPAAAPNDHPIEVSDEDIVRALGALRVSFGDDEGDRASPRPVFAKDELGVLGKQISLALARADPRQDVTFSTLGVHRASEGSFLKHHRINSGRIFYQGGKLNVIFGEIQAVYRKKNVYGQRDQDFRARSPGERGSSRDHEWQLAAVPGVELQGSGREDWVAIDAGALAAVTATERSAAVQPVIPETPTATPPAAAAAAAPPAPVLEDAPAALQATPDAARIEYRLRVLKDLRDQELITEEAYRAKLEEILADL